MQNYSMTVVLLIFSTSVLLADAAPSALVRSMRDSDPSVHIRERGIDFAVYQRVTSTTNGNDIISSTTNEFTLLENGLHYLEGGEWKTSEDLIESFPGGAVARRGPNKTIFSPVLKAEAVFDMETSEGDRIRGGVRSIQLTDYKTGRSVVLASVKDGIRGEVVPPNQVVYRDGFDGLAADVLYVWKHNFFSQNVILRKRPMLPPEMDPATTRLEVVSELVESPEPVLNSRAIANPDGSKRRDDVTFRLGSLLTLHGRAFPVSGEKSLVLTGDPLADENSVGVAKEYFQLNDGRKFLIESVGWEEIQPMLKTLDTASIGDGAAAAIRHLADSRTWPDRVAPLEKKEPMQLASVPYQSTGFLVDVSWVPLSGSTSSYTFLSGKTYYIAQSFYLAGTATTTFQPGCVIKYGNNAWLLLHCPFTFPPSGQLMPVLTSKDDDAFGVMISGSTHVPSEMADGALWLYFVAEQTTEIKNVRIRYAKKSIRLDAYNGAEPVHTVKDSLLQYGQTGIYGSMTDGTVVLDNVKQCDVDQPVNCACFAVVGSMTADCSALYTVANFAGIKQQGESGSDIPDTMGAVGPNHFMVILNAQTPGYSVAVYNKYTGARVSPPTTTLSQFFTVNVTSGPYFGTYPSTAPGCVDSQIVFDQDSQRWIAITMDRSIHGTTSGSSRYVLLAVSNGSDPYAIPGDDWYLTNWKHYLVPFAPDESTCDIDRPILGVDKNGIYICVKVFGCDPEDEIGQIKIAAIPKAPLIANPPTASTVQENFVLTVSHFGGGPLMNQAINFESISTADPAWFILNASDKLYYNRLRWINGMNNSPQWELSVPGVPGAWPSLAITQTFRILANGQANIDIEAPQYGSSGKADIASGLMCAYTRMIAGVQYLWTCHAVGVNRNGTHEPTASPSNPADRSGIAWYKIRLDATVTIENWGRVYDNATTSPKFYYTPSLAVNKNGDMVLGFSGSSVTEYISAYYSGRLGTGEILPVPRRYFEGKDVHYSSQSPFKWGDYSFSCLDPDGLTVWSIQAYSETTSGMVGERAWGTRIVGISTR